jgi:hypothetical protein
MKKSILIFSFLSSLFLASEAVQADNLCVRRAEARRHTAMSQAQLAYNRKVASCRTMASPDRAEQCIQVARATYERDTQVARARYAADVRICNTQS